MPTMSDETDGRQPPRPQGAVVAGSFFVARPRRICPLIRRRPRASNLSRWNGSEPTIAGIPGYVRTLVTPAYGIVRHKRGGLPT